MAIDTSVFMVDIPTGAVSRGDTFEMVCTDGPSVVRSGRGAALLKRVTSFKISVAGVSFNCYVKNSDWIDPIINECGPMGITTLDKRTGAYQSGNNCNLTPNSAWTVTAVATTSGTVSAAGTIVTLIDIDYPAISSITDPDAIPGIPTSIIHTFATAPIEAAGSLVGTGWTTVNVDMFKAGYEYALQKISVLCGTNTALVSISNAAGMGGLQRILACYGDTSAIRSIVEYASKLVKGPMDIKLKLISTSSGTATNTDIIFDFVKRRV